MERVEDEVSAAGWDYGLEFLDFALVNTYSSSVVCTYIGTYNVLEEKSITGLWLGAIIPPPSYCLWYYWDLSSIESDNITTDTVL